MSGQIPIYVINRAQDKERLNRFMASIDALHLKAHRIAAVDGHDPAAPLFLYRHLLRDHFRGTAAIKPGAFACFLSHMAAWRRLIADGCEWALICEDDVILRAPPKRPDADVDLVYVNDRMRAWCGPQQGLGSLPDVLAKMRAAKRAPGQDNLAPAPGADAYILSKNGAERLLAAVEADGIVTGVDWAMISCSLPVGTLADWQEAAGARYQPSALQAAIADQAIGGSAPIRGGSKIGHKTTTSIDDFAKIPPVLDVPDMADDPVCAALRDGHFAEQPALEMMYRWFPKDGVFVDVGAHVGNHSLFMLRHGGAARAVPFEFHPRACQAMEQFLHANGVSADADFAHLGIGLAEESGKRALRGTGRLPCRARLKRDFVEDIKVRAGDVLLRGEPAIAMIKIDVNGEEREVLKGLKKTMKRKMPLIALDMTAERSAKALPILQRHQYVEVERVNWYDNGHQKAFAIFRCEGPAAIETGTQD